MKAAFLVDTGGTTYTFILGKPTWDKLFKGLKDVGGNILRATLNQGTQQAVTLLPTEWYCESIDLIGTDFFDHMEASFKCDL
jgi:hypothetical protein